MAGLKHGHARWKHLTHTVTASLLRLPDYRIICQLQHPNLVVLVVAIGHRSIIYGD